MLLAAAATTTHHHNRHLHHRPLHLSPSLPSLQIIKRAAHELFDGAYVNLGIGIPTLVSDYVPAGAYFRAILRNSAQLF